MRMLVAALLCVCLCVCRPPRAHASDFWDEVRTPGLRAYRQRLAEATRTLYDGRAIDALAHAQWAAERLAERPEAHHVRGQVLGALGRHAEAAQAFERAVALDPAALDDPTSATSAATSAVAAGRLDLAERVLRRALARLRGGRRAALLVWHGDVLQALGPERSSEAMLAYREALRDAPEQRARALLGLALALHRGGERDEALALARQIPGGAEVEREIERVSPLPTSERVARSALRLDAVGDLAGAAAHWDAVARSEGPWREHAQRAAREPRTAR